MYQTYSLALAVPDCSSHDTSFILLVTQVSVRGRISTAPKWARPDSIATSAFSICFSSHSVWAGGENTSSRPGPEHYRNFYLGGMKAPGRPQRNNVVYPAVRGIAERLDVDLRNQLPQRDIPYDLFVRSDQIRP